jgi:hypothetical protein
MHCQDRSIFVYEAADGLHTYVYLIKECSDVIMADGGRLQNKFYEKQLQFRFKLNLHPFDKATKSCILVIEAEVDYEKNQVVLIVVYSMWMRGGGLTLLRIQYSDFRCADRLGKTDHRIVNRESEKISYFSIK